jgi:hypothetical protein
MKKPISELEIAVVGFLNPVFFQAVEADRFARSQSRTLFGD